MTGAISRAALGDRVGDGAGDGSSKPSSSSRQLSDVAVEKVASTGWCSFTPSCCADWLRYSTANVVSLRLPVCATSAGISMNRQSDILNAQDYSSST